MKFCPECGEKLVSDKMKFCSECGANLLSYIRPENGKEKDVKPDAQNLSVTADEANDVSQNSAEEKNESIPIQKSKNQNETEQPETEDTEDTEETEEECAQENTVEDAPAENSFAIDGDQAENEEKIEEKIEEKFEEKIEEPIESSREIQESDAADESDGSEGKIGCYTVEVEYSKEDFVRALWINMAREEVPRDVFNCNYGEVEVVDEEIYERSLEVNVDYSASLGYYRQEPYIDYETYYEKEPYITTEDYYDYNTHSKATRQVTKYKDVARQRQVTKYKTVIDWSAFSGNGSVDLFSTVSNTGRKLNVPRFLESICAVSEEKRKKYDFAVNGVLTESARKEATKENRSDIYDFVIRSLPGDESKDISYNVKDVLDSTEAIFKVKEYFATLSYEGGKYTNYAFPFGNMSVGGDVISNDESSENVTKRMTREVEEKNEKDKNRIDKLVFERTMWYWIATVSLLVISTVLSCFLRYLAPLIVTFCLAIAAYVMTNIKFKSNEKQVSEEIEQYIQKRNKKLQEDIKNYSSNYKKIMFEELSKKLSALGLKPITEDELFGGEEKDES